MLRKTGSRGDGPTASPPIGSRSIGRRVHLEQPIHEEALALLRENAEVSVGFGPEARELDDALLGEVNALLVRTKPLGAGEIEKAPRLRMIARHGVGVDNVAVEAATRRAYPS